MEEELNENLEDELFEIMEKKKVQLQGMREKKNKWHTSEIEK